MSEPDGRRERNMADKRQRIFTAAADLFDTHGYDGVTTGRVAAAADVANGTVFRYANSKAELLLMVYNARFRDALRDGVRAAADHLEPVPAIMAMIEPIIARAAAHPGNFAVYQRELLFGAPRQVYRTVGIDLVGELEAAIAARLLAAAPSGDEAGADRAARTVFAVLSLLLSQPSTGVRTGVDDIAELKDQITQIVHGYLATQAGLARKGN